MITTITKFHGTKYTSCVLTITRKLPFAQNFIFTNDLSFISVHCLIRRNEYLILQYLCGENVPFYGIWVWEMGKTDRRGDCGRGSENGEIIFLSVCYKNILNPKNLQFIEMLQNYKIKNLI